MDFATLFQDVLAQFDTQPDNFSPQRVQDELVGQMAELLEADYDTLSLEIDDSESRQRALTSDPAPLQAADLRCRPGHRDHRHRLRCRPALGAVVGAWPWPGCAGRFHAGRQRQGHAAG
jgi:hypothetical protein